MAFTEWEFFYGVVAQRAYVDVVAPLVGSGSLRLVGAPAGPGAILGRWAQESNRGFRQGRVTTLIQPVSGVPGEDMYGVYGAASQDDLTGTTGTAYAGVLVAGPPWELRLLKITAGFGSPPIVLQALPITFDYGDILGLQLQWLSESSFGTMLRLAIGSALDYTDLVGQPIVQEAGVLLENSEGEGPMAYLTASGDCRFDQTQNEEI